MSPTSKRNRTVIYTRVSRDDSGEGKSNERQEHDCRIVAGVRGFDVIDAVSDISRSAYSKVKRPGWERVLEMVRSGDVDIVMASRMDRVTRTTRELLEIADLCNEYDVRVITVDGDLDLSSAQGRMLATVVGSVAQMEVERKSERQKSGNAARRAEGLPWPSGWRAFGYELDGTVVKSEAALIREAAERVLDGASLKSIVRHWQALGVSTPRSSKGVDGWTHNGVRSILLNPRNAGLATYKGEVTGRGAWEPIITETTHALLVAMLTNPDRLSRSVSRGRTASNLLTGIARCATCDEPVTGGTGHKGQLIYQCKGYHVSTSREEADRAVEAAFIATVSTTRPGLLMPSAPTDVPADLWRDLETIRERQVAVGRMFTTGSLTEQQVQVMTADLRGQEVALEARLAECTEGATHPLARRAESLAEFAALDLDGKRALLERVAVVTLFPKGRGRRNVPITDQVTVFLRATRRPSAGKFIPADQQDSSGHAEETKYLIPALDDRVSPA